MDEKQKSPASIWKKTWNGPMAFLFFLLVVSIAVFVLALSITAVTFAWTPLLSQHEGVGHGVWCVLWIMAGFIATVVIILVLCGAYRWLFGRIFTGRNFKRLAFVFACLVTLLALFYAEEDWRGKHDWEAYQREAAARGEKLDWSSVVPPPVPDDQNFAFSPVWIAEEKYVFLNTPKRAEAWYGDRIYNDDVTKLVSLLPVSVSGLVGTNWWANPPRNLPTFPDVTNSWPMGVRVDLKPWQSYYRALQQSNSAAEISVTPEPQSPAQDVLLALSKFDPVIEQLRADSALPESRFPVSYDDDNPAGILLPHLAALKRHCQVLELRSLAELEIGQTNQAFDDIKLSFRLIGAIRSEPFPISQLVRVVMFELTLQPLWEGLAEHKWSDAQLIGFDRELAQLDFLADYESSMRGECVFHARFIAYMQRQRSLRKFNGLPDLLWNQPGLEALKNLTYYLLAPAGWFEQSKVQLSRVLTENYFPVIDVERHVVSVDQVNKIIASESASNQSGDLMEWLSIPKFGMTGKKFAYAQAFTDLARVAIALERYRLANGQYPESLDMLTPQFISDLPHDVINGQPLKYRREANGQFVLYSVGWNETDDGGMVVLNKGSAPGVDFDQGDWVWRYPSRD
jgi:hypothetical protein